MAFDKYFAERTRVAVSYLFDYAIIVACIVGFLILDKVDGYKQHFSLTNIALQYPYAERDRVPVWAVGVLAVIGPFVICGVWILVEGAFAGAKTKRSLWWELNAMILGLGLSTAGTIVITGIFKNVTGRPRPDIIARCLPFPGTADPQPFGLVSAAVCTQTDSAILKDGWKSFFSGHTSIAFGGLGYLSLWVAGRAHVLDQRGEVWKTFVILVPLLAASLVGLSRIQDAKHHPFDVIFAAMVGMLVAWGSYRQYYPGLASPQAGWAHPLRTLTSRHSEDGRTRFGMRNLSSFDTPTRGSPVSRHIWQTSGQYPQGQFQAGTQV